MNYNVFGGTLNLTQPNSVVPAKDGRRYGSDLHSVVLCSWYLGNWLNEEWWCVLSLSISTCLSAVSSLTQYARNGTQRSVRKKWPTTLLVSVTLYALRQIRTFNLLRGVFWTLRCSRKSLHFLRCVREAGNRALIPRCLTTLDLQLSCLSLRASAVFYMLKCDMKIRLLQLTQT